MSKPRTPEPSSLALATYGLVMSSVVLAATDEQRPSRLALVVAGQALALFVAHAYADMIGHQRTVRAAASHAKPALLASVPAITIVSLGWLLALNGDAVVFAALMVNLTLLLVVQRFIAKKRLDGSPRLLMTVVTDAVLVIIVVAMVALLK